MIYIVRLRIETMLINNHQIKYYYNSATKILIQDLQLE